MSYNTYAVNEKDYTHKNPSKKIEKAVKRIILVISIIFASQLVWLFVITPFIPFSSLEIQDFDGFGRNDIIRIAGITETSSFMSTNVNDIVAKLNTNVLVESVRVIKRFPDRLSIFVTQRKPVAITLTFIDSKQQLLYIDRNGVFFKQGEIHEADPALPIISGFDNPQINMRLPAALVPLMENISVISASSPELLSAISEIRVEPKAWDGYDLVLYPVHSTIKVRVDSNLTEEIIRYMLLMLNVLEENNPKPREVDFRSGIGSYKIKEPSLW